MRVLIVDDESSLRITLAANLELEIDGLEVVEAANAQEALDLIGRERFDLVLSDVRMPGLSGVEMFERIKLISPDLPVILMTAYAVEEQLDRAVQGGVFTVLSKPFAIEQAVSVINRASTLPNVLVVDPDGADDTVRMLRAAGLRAEAMADLANAGEAVRSGNIDVCIADLGAPESGDLLANLANSGLSIAIVGVAKGADSALLARLAPLVQGFLNKPVAGRDLVGVVAKARRDSAAR